MHYIIIAQVCPPGIHSSLGIFRLFTLLEDACHGLDVLIIQHLTTESAGASFIQYADAMQQQFTLRDDIDTVKGQIACFKQCFTLMIVTLLVHLSLQHPPPGDS